MKNLFTTYCFPAVIAIFVFTATTSTSNRAAADSSLFTLHSSLNNTLHSSLNDTVEVLFTGDILLDRGVRQRIEHIGVERLFSKGIDSLFRQSDYVVGNLECPATKTIQPNFKKFVFRAEPEWLSTLREHHVTHLNLANNHSIDQGRAGLVDTWQNIRKAGIVPVGAGNNLEEAIQPVLICDNPRPVWLFASLRLTLENYSFLPDKPCVSQESVDSLCQRIIRLRQSQPEAYIIVSLHWGGEHTLKPVPQQRKEARQLIDAGADVLICHHTHTLQTIEDYNGHRIYYSIGNFIFDQQKPINTRACMVRLKITRESSLVETIPVEIRKCVPYILN